MILDQNRVDDDDIKRHTRCLYSRGNALVKRFKYCSNKVKNVLFQSYCSNAYGSQLWSQYSKRAFRKASVAYNDVYRFLFSVRRGESISGIYVQNNILGFNALLRKSVYSFKTRLQLSANCIIKAINRSLFFIYDSMLLKKWTNMLYM